MKLAILLAGAVALAACSDSEGKPDKGGAGKAGPTEAVIAAWKKAGLTVTAFDHADGAAYGGGECTSGQINGVDTVLCQYASPELAKAAQPKGLDAVGEATGTALVHDSLLMVVVDRRKADPEGRTINQATKLFRGSDRPAAAP